MGKKRAPSIYDTETARYASGRQYDDQFETPLTERQGLDLDTRFGIKYNDDYLLGDENPYTYRGGLDVTEEDPFNDIRAGRQGFVDTALSGISRAAIKGVAEAAKTPGVIMGTIGGLTGELTDLISGQDNNNFVATAFNNPWIKGIDNLNKAFQDETMPVYVHKAIQDGDIFDKFFSSEFWATDGADGVGYAVGMMLPGAAIGKLGLGTKLIGGANKLDKAFDIFQGADRAEDFVRIANTAGATARRIDTGIAVTYNTVAEAGAEAKEFGDRLRQPENKAKMIEGWKKSGYLNSPEYRDGVIAYYEDLDRQRRDGKITIEEQQALANDRQNVMDNVLERRFEDQVSKGELGVFGTNAMILIGPNALMYQQLFGRVGRAAEKIAEKGATRTAATITGEGAEAATKFGKVAKALEPATKFIAEKGAKYGKVAATNIASEGFWEEGMQTTVSNMYENYAKSNNIDYAMEFNAGDVAREYADMIGSTEGQVAVLLGAVLGTGMSSISEHFKTKEENKVKNAILNRVDVALNNFNTAFNASDIYERDETGNIILDTDAQGNELNKPKVNQEKAADLVKSLAVTEFEKILYQHAIDQGNHGFIRQKQEEALFQMVLPAIYNGKKGLDLLKQQLDSNKDFQDILARDADPSTKFKFKDVVEKALKTAEHLQKENDKFNDFSDAMISLEDERLDGSKASKDIRTDYMNELNQRYLQSKFRIMNNEERLKELETQRDNALQELNIQMTPGEMSTNTRLVNNLMSTNPLFKNTIEEINKVSQEIRKDKNDIAEVWDGKATKLSFKEFVGEKLKAIKESDNEDEASNVITQVSNAQTQEELSDILNKDHDKDFPEKEKIFEYQKIKQLVNSINEDGSVENIEAALNALKNTDYNSYNVQKLIKTLENRIGIIQKERDQFKKELNKIVDEYGKFAKDTISYLKTVQKSIDDLTKIQEKKLKELKSYPEKIRGRNSKVIKESIKALESEIKDVDNQIEDLTKQKEKLEEDLKKIDSRLDPLLNALENIDKQDFRSINDVVNYLKNNRDEFRDHRHDISRLTLKKFYTEQNVEGLEKAISSLEGYKESLEKLIRELLDSENNYSEELYYLQEKLNDTIEGLEDAKKELITETAKLERLSNAIIDKDLREILSEEVDFFEKLAEVRKSKPKTIFSNILVDKLVNEKKKELNDKENILNNEEEAKSEQLSKMDEMQLRFVEENFSVGEDFTIHKSFGLSNKLTGVTATVTKIVPGKSVSFETPKGVKGTISLDNFYKALYNPEINFGSEGGFIESVEEGQRFDNDKPPFTTGGSKVISVDEDGNRLPFVDESFVEFERNPNVVKTGQKVTFEINTSATQNENWRSALAAYHAGDFNDIDLLINHLPINIVFGNGQKAPMETYYESKEKGSEQFDKTSKILRNSIINELKAGKELSSLSTNVEGQYNGTLQVEETVLENKVQDLYEFGGNIDNIKSDNIYIVDDKGVLRNHKDAIFPTNRSLSPGEIYIQIHTAAGLKFPLKLNVRKITSEQADVLYDLYKYRFEDIKNRTKARTLKEVREDNPELVKKIERNLEKELKVIGKKTDDVSIKDLVDFLIWDGTNSIKSRIKFQNTRGNITKLAVFENEFTQEEFDILPRQTFIAKVTSAERGALGKRQHIKFKPTKDSGVKGVNLGNRSYLQYLLEEGILNTNAIVGIENQTFQGVTNMYLNTRGLKVGDDLSAFNPEEIVEVSNEKVIGSSEKFQETHPELYEMNLVLNESGTKYIDSNGKEYDRVSELKTKDGDVEGDINVDSTVRGDVIDELMRKHLGSLITMDVEQFKEYGKKTLSEVNTRKGTTVQFSDVGFEQLYSILEDYKVYFQKEGIKILTSTPTLAGNIGNRSFAGTIDIFGYDTKTGEYMIIDLKTSTVSRVESYENPETDKWNYVFKDAVQQNAYAELFEQMTGKPINKLFIMPLIIPKESKNSYNVGEVLKDDAYLIPVSMDKNIYQLKGIQRKATTKIAPVAKGLDSLLLKDWQKAMKAGAKPDMTMKHGGIQYGYIDSVGVMAYQDKNKNLIMVQDKDLILKIIKESNAKIGNRMAAARVDVNKFEKNWNSRLNSVSLQDSQKPAEKPTEAKPKIVAPAIKATPKPKEVTSKLEQGGFQSAATGIPTDPNLINDMFAAFEPANSFGEAIEPSAVAETIKDTGLKPSERTKEVFDELMGYMPSVTTTTQNTKGKVKETLTEVVSEPTINFKSLNEDQVNKGIVILEEFQTANDSKQIDKIWDESKDNKQALEKIYNYLIGKGNAEIITSKLKGCK